ncbi:MAG: NAD-dependent aldehyde dehydrogenase [Herminiimonas sp.]|nr:NAD-dependent aldehyde dehydrogenase [Herminiimonas sp.]
MDNDDVISTLNDLIETSKDGEEGFRTCAEDISDPQLKSLFAERAQGCSMAVSELQEQVRSLGGDPEKSSSISGKLHRRWVDIKSAITGKDDEAILSECERGEDVAVSSYRKALEKDLPPNIRSLVERQYNGVLRNHDQVKSLREQIRTAKNLTR